MAAKKKKARKKGGAAPKAVDWKVVERDYRAGIKTVRQIGAERGISGARISQKATEDGWTRDLSARIEKAREAKLNKAALNKTLNKADKPKEDALVEANAEMQKNVILSHREELGRSRNAVNVLVDELVALCDPALQDALGDLLTEKMAALADSPQKRAALAKAFDAALSLNGRAKVVKDLTIAQQTVITQERLAFGIDKNTGETSFEDAIRALRQLSESGS